MDGSDPQQLLIESIFPKFVLRSAVGGFCAAQVLLFFVSCWLLSPRSLYVPNGGTAWKLGSADHVMEQCAVHVGGKFIVEFRRLFVPIFLHVNFMHLVGNLSVQISLGPRMLATYGAEVYASLFLMSGACGNILSGAFCVGGIGASTSCLGLVGALLAQVWLIWDSLENQWKEWLRNILILTIIVGIAAEIVLSFFIPINHYGHAGGLVGGFALAVVLTREAPLPIIPANVPALPNNIAKRRQCCMIFLLTFVGVCFFKTFVWDSQPVVMVPINGTMTEVNSTEVYCEQRWATYFV
jgi:membrane associated rhomboid family serine protease